MNVGPNTQGERVRVRVGPREARGAKALYSYGKGYQNLNQSQHVAICSLEALHCFQLKFARLQDLLSIVQLLPLTLMIRTTGRRVISIRLRMIEVRASRSGKTLNSTCHPSSWASRLYDQNHSCARCIYRTSEIRSPILHGIATSITHSFRC
jgi:hypothetical protein